MRLRRVYPPALCDTKHIWTDQPVNQILGYSYGDNTVYNPNYPSVYSFTFDNHYNLSLYNSFTVNITITGANYNFLGNLITDLNSAIVTALSPYSGYSIVLSVADSNNPFVVITANFPVIVNKTTLSAILGFDGFETWGQGSMSGNKMANIRYDSSFYLYLEGLPCSHNSASGKRQHFKIPVVGKDTPNQYHDNLSFQQEMKMANSSYTLNSLKPLFIDRFGYNTSINDFQFTLLFEF